MATSDYLERLLSLKESLAEVRRVLIFEMERGRDRVVFRGKDSALRRANIMRMEINELIREEKKYLRSNNENDKSV